MNNVSRGLLLCVVFWCSAGWGASFDCRYAHTPVEQAICSNPELRGLDRELGLMSERAVLQSVASPRDIRRMRNQLVRRCRHSDHLAECLIDAERQEIDALIRHLQGTIDTPEAIAADKPVTAEGRSAQVSSAVDKLADAEHQSLRDGDPEPVIAAAVDLLDLYRAELVSAPTDHQLVTRIRGLEDKLSSGCDDRTRGEKWRKLLSENGQVCRS